MKICNIHNSLIIIFLTLLVVWPSPDEASAQGETSRASVDSSGGQANGESEGFSSMSGDGRYVAFKSWASNLVPNDTNWSPDIFVRDRVAGTTERVSVNSNGEEGNNSSNYATISADGRYVAFFSMATNLVPNDINSYWDIFVHDRLTKITEKVSVDSAGVGGNGHSEYPSISGDGRYVAFESEATNLVPGDTNGKEDVFVHDRQTGTTVRASVSSTGGEGNGYCLGQSISADGRYVAFISWSSNLVTGDNNNVTDTFVHDLQTGQTVRISIDSCGTEGNGMSYDCSTSSDGRYVAFTSAANNLVLNDNNSGIDVFVHDCQTGDTTRASVDPCGGDASGDSQMASISLDGRYVAFKSTASDLVDGDANLWPDIFAHDRETGNTWLVSVSSSGGQSNHESQFPAISGDGRSVAFDTGADNLVPGDTNNKRDIFVHDNFSLFADTEVLPEAGGVVNFSLDAGATNGNRNYLMLGSVTGSFPGTPLPGGIVTLPLNWDAFTNIVLALANTPVFSNFMSALDASGQAAAQLSVSAALPPGTAGLSMTFAYSLPGPFDFVSNAVEIEVIP